MKLISLSSIIANTPVRRNLDDRNFTVQSKDVSFDECIRTVRDIAFHASNYLVICWLYAVVENGENFVQ